MPYLPRVSHVSPQIPNGYTWLIRGGFTQRCDHGIIMHVTLLISCCGFAPPQALFLSSFFFALRYNVHNVPCGLFRQTFHHREKYSQILIFVLYPSRLGQKNTFAILQKIYRRQKGVGQLWSSMAWLLSYFNIQAVPIKCSKWTLFNNIFF